jgi:microcystin-dependent protein
MSVPFRFANVPGGTTIPLSEIDADFDYITGGNPTFASLTLTGALSVGGTTTLTGLATLNGGLSLSGPLTIGGNTVVPNGITGSNLLVFNTAPTLISPILGTPQSGNLLNCTNLPINTGISGLGLGIIPFLQNPTSANLAAAVADETGTGQLVFNNNPVLNAPSLTNAALGTPASGNLVACTGYLMSNIVGVLPISQGGTGQTTAAAAANALLPPQSGLAGDFLTTDGLGGLSWVPNANGSVTSITLNPATTGLTVNGSPAGATITTSGTFTLGGVLVPANGGTGVTSLGTGVQAAIQNPVDQPGGLLTYSAITPPGAVLFFAAPIVPTGWLEADGAAVSRTTYAALFGVIGVLYGSGDGSTTFNVPDLRGYFIRGWADGGPIDAGRGFGTTQAQQVGPITVTDPGHKHTMNPAGGGNGVVGWTTPGGAGQGWASGNYGAPTAFVPQTEIATTGITISGTGTETRPVNIAMLACIKY